MAEGIRISTNNFHYAPWYRRLGALIVDMLLVNFLVLLFVPGTMTIGELVAGAHWSDLLNFMLAGAGMWFWIMPTIYLMLMWGWLSRTVGMFAMKTKVIDESGKKIGWIKAVLRTFGYGLSGVMLFLGFLPILFDKKRQGLHDKLTKTFVVMKR